MCPATYAEDTLVQQTTADYLEQQLSWQSVYAYNNEDYGPGSLLGRDTARRRHERHSHLHGGRCSWTMSGG
jgi:type I restriction enzyme, R subunit